MVGAWVVFRNRRPVVAWLATTSLVAYGTEAVLGALVVFGELPSWLVAVHLGMAMIIVGCLAIGAYDRGYSEALERRKAWRTELVARTVVGTRALVSARKAS